MTCFDIYGVIFMSVNISLIVLKKINDILMIFVENFHDFGWFFATRIRIRSIEADPDPADQNETDPNGSGSATLNQTVVSTAAGLFFLSWNFLQG